MQELCRKRRYHLVSLIIVFIISGVLILPVFYLYNMAFRFSDLFILITIPCLFFYKPAIPKETSFYLYLIFVLGAIFSLIHGYNFLDVPSSYRDWNEIIKISYPLLIMLALVNVDKDFLIKILTKFLYYGSFFIIFVAAIQFFLPDSFGVLVASMYNNGYQLQGYIDYKAARIFVTGSDPNTGAAIILFFLFFNIICFLVKRKLKFLFVSAFLLLTLFFTGSRTGIIAFVVSLLVVLMLTNVKYKRYNVLIFLIISIMLFVVIPKVPYIYVGFNTFLKGTNTSVLARVENMQEVFHLLKQSMFLGWGPAKAIHPTIIDGEYFSILRRYGILGISLIFIFMLYNLIKILKNRTLLYYNDINGAYLLSILVIGYSISILFIMLTNSFISSYQLMLPYVLMSFLLHLKIREVRKQ